MDERQLVRQISSPLFDAKGWLPIWMGVLLFSAANKIEAARSHGDIAALTETMSKLKTFFIINGALVLISILGFAIAFLVTGGAIVSGISSFN